MTVRLARETASRLYWGGMFYTLIAALYTPMLGAGRAAAWTMAAVLAVLGVMRTYACRRVLRCPDAAVVSEARNLGWVAAVQGLVVGMYIAWVLMCVRGDAVRECIMLVGVAGLSSVIASLFAPDRRLAAIQLAAQLIPAYALPIYGYSRYGPTLVAFIVIHFIAVIQVVRVTSNHVRRMFLTQMTLERQSADLRHARDAAEQASSARMRFLANMSHEIRTPLNGVIGLAQVLADTPLNDDQHRVLSDIGHSGEHLLAVVNDILDMAKVSSGKLVLEHVRFELPALIHEVAVPAAVLAGAKGIEFKVDSNALPRYVEGDPVRMRQVISNLLSNAVKFTESGRVSLAAEATRDGWVRVSVRDTGIGLSEEQVQGLFQEFHQVDSSTTRRFGGTGLGLAICKRLVDLMGGELRVESRLGEGSEFSFEIPLPLTAQAPESPEAAAARSMPPGIRVLVAEDNAVNQTVIRKFLSGWGVEAEVVENGLLAVERHRQAPYDLILMDCQMPEMDGYEATASIRALDGPAAATPIIGVTAGAFREDGERCLRSGMNGHVPKPLNRETLLTAMMDALENQLQVTVQP